MKGEEPFLLEALRRGLAAHRPGASQRPDPGAGRLRRPPAARCSGGDQLRDASRGGAAAGAAPLGALEHRGAGRRLVHQQRLGQGACSAGAAGRGALGRSGAEPGDDPHQGGSIRSNIFRGR